MSSSETQSLLPSYETIVKKKDRFVLTDAAGRKVIVKRGDPRFDALLAQYQAKLEHVYSRCMGGL